MNNLFRKFFKKVKSLDEPKPQKKLSPLSENFSRILMIIIKAIRNLTLRLLLLVFLIFTFVWVVVTVLLFQGKILSYIGETGSIQLLGIGAFIVGIGIIIIIVTNTEKINVLKDWFSKTSVYSIFATWIYQLSQLYVSKILLPNIDLIEPGLNLQNTASFPNVISYDDENAQSPDHIIAILNNHQKALATLGLILLCVLFVLLPLFGHIRILSDIIGWVFLITMLSVYFVWVLPESIVGTRIQALKIEYAKLRRDEWLQSRINEIEKYTEGVVKEYSERLSEIRSLLGVELNKLNTLQHKLIITQEDVEGAYNLVRNNQSVVRLLLQENQILQDEREKQKYWKDKAVDIGIGIIVGIITGFLLGR